MSKADELKAKANWQLSLRLNAVLSLFDLYGLGSSIPLAKEEIMWLADVYYRTRAGEWQWTAEDTEQLQRLEKQILEI